MRLTFLFSRGINIFIIITILLTSCAPTYLTPSNTFQKSYLRNQGFFSVQNMDELGKIEPQSLTVHYNGFDVKYNLSKDFVVSFEIINNTNKSLIIDKSKCYVLYNGYSTDLFKDVRSSRSTTFNNVQDAINNVQTSDASVTMTIPPYSKWTLPFGETNIRNITSLPAYIENTGTYIVQSYDNPEHVEFVLPYTFDYSLAKWNTSRNRIYVSQIDVTVVKSYVTPNPTIINNISYSYGKTTRESNNTYKAEIDRINTENIRRWKKHRHAVNASHIFWLLPTFGLSTLSNMSCNDNHRPLIYNSDGSSAGEYNKHYNNKAKY